MPGGGPNTSPVFSKSKGEAILKVEFEKLLTPNEVAAMLQTNSRTVQALARKHKLPGVKIGKFWRFRGSELERWVQGLLDSNRQPCRASF